MNDKLPPPGPDWEEAIPTEPEPSPTLITSTQLLSAYENWLKAYRARDESMGTLPGKPLSLTEYIRQVVPEEDRGNPEGKIYLRVDHYEEITTGNPHSIVVRIELSRALEAILKETGSQEVRIPFDWGVDKQTYATIGILDDNNHANGITSGWIAETNTFTWPGSPQTIAVGSAIAKALKDAKQPLLIEIGKKLTDLDEIFGNMGDPNQ